MKSEREGEVRQHFLSLTLSLYIIILLCISILLIRYGLFRLFRFVRFCFILFRFVRF